MAFDQTWGAGWNPAPQPAPQPTIATPSAPGGPGGPASAPVTGGGFALPSWGSLANSPFVLAANALGAQQLAALKAQMGSSAARALVNLGDVGLAGQVRGISLPGGTSGLVDQANTAGTSVLSQLLHQHGLNQGTIPAQLAGRGFYRSGQTGYSLGEENRSYGNQQYKARQSTLDYLNGLYSNYLNAQFGIQQQQLSAYMQAYQSALSMAMSQAQLAAGTGPVPQLPPSPSSRMTLSDWIGSQGGFSGLSR